MLIVHRLVQYFFRIAKRLVYSNKLPAPTGLMIVFTPLRSKSHNFDAGNDLVNSWRIPQHGHSC